jgi:hypothetical protein
VANCKGCGALIVWAELANGKRVPLDPRPAVYDVTLAGVAHEALTAERADRRRYMVSHFATCPEANRFSGASKGRKAEEGR